MTIMDEPPKEDQLLHIAQAGKWSMYVEQLIAAIHYYFFEYTWHGLRVGVLQYTEVSPPKFRRPLKRYCRKYGLRLHHPRGLGRGECMTITRKELKINRLRSHARRASDLRLKVGRTAPTFLLTTRIRGWGRFHFLHTPAHNKGLMRGLFETKVWISVMGGVRRLIKPDFNVEDTLGGDMNVDLERDKMEATVKSFLGHDMHYAGSAGQAPDLGNRIITGVWSSLLIVHRSITLGKRPGHDHGGVATILGRVDHRA